MYRVALSSDERRHLVAQRLAQVALDLPFQRGVALLRGFKDDVAAGNKRLYLGKPQLGKQPA